MKHNWKPTIMLVGFPRRMMGLKKQIRKKQLAIVKNLQVRSHRKENQMVVQNNNIHWVILAAIVLCMSMTFGAILNGSFGTSQGVRDEQARVDIRATEGALSVIETPQAIFADQTAVVAKLTALPPAQTATAIAFSESHVALQQAATEAAIANAQNMGNLAVAATATAVAESQRIQTLTVNSVFGLAILVVVTVCVWVFGRVTRNTFDAYTQHSIAQAKALEQQRQLAEFRAAHQKASRPIVQQSLPTSLMKERGNGHKLPRAE